MPFDADGFAVMEQPIQDGGGDGAVVVEDLGPGFVAFVAGEQDRSAFVAVADDLEEELCALFVDGRLARRIG